MSWSLGCSVAVRDLVTPGSGDRFLQLPAQGLMNGSEATETSPVKETFDDRLHVKQKTFKGRCATIVAVAVSPKWLACGEQGHKPRLCIYDMTKLAEPNCGPFFTSHAHMYGIKHLSFSSNSQLLVSIGYVHDGNIHIWKISPNRDVTQLASNRVTANLECVAWIGDRELVTAGLRHLRIWNWRDDRSSGKSGYRSTAEAPVVLEGRNVILGHHVHSRFAAACNLDESRFLAAANNNICLVNTRGRDGVQDFLRFEFEVTFVKVESQFLIVGGAEGQMRQYNLQVFDFLDRCISSSSSSVDVSSLTCHISAEYESSIQAYCRLDRDQVLIAFADGSFGVSSTKSASMMLPSTSSTLCCKDDVEGNLLVASGDGRIRKLTAGWQSLQTVVSEAILTAIAFLGSHWVLLGSATGEVILKSLDILTNTTTVRAHEHEVLRIRHSEDEKMILSYSRDKDIQLFDIDLEKHQLILRQTFAEHTANISEALFVGNSFLVSCSMDRTVIVRARDSESSVFQVTKILDLKSAALSMVLVAKSSVLVSCLNKSLLTINILSGSFDASVNADRAYDHLLVDPELKFCIGIATQDRSLCLVSLETGLPMSYKLFTHAEAVTSLSWSCHDKNLVYTTSTDGVVIAWAFSANTDSGTRTPVKRIFLKSETGSMGKFRAQQKGLTNRDSGSPRGRMSNPSPRTPLRLSETIRDRKVLQSLDASHIRPRSSNDESSDIGATIRDTIYKLKLLESSSSRITEQDKLDLQNAAKWLSATTATTNQIQSADTPQGTDS